MKAQRGFTLIEALVVGIIAAGVPAVVLTVINLNTTSILETTNRTRLVLIHDAVSEEIRRSADSAGKAQTACTDGLLSLGGNQGVILCDSTGVITQKGFRVIDLGDGIGLLQEAVAGGAWKSFVVGEDTVRLATAPTTGKAAGVFGVGGPYTTFHGFYYNIRLVMPVAGVASSLPMQTESVICRNALPW